MVDIPTEYQVRLRHVQGDLGPFTLPGQTTMLELGELACSEWPEDGPLLEVKPGSPSEVRLISAGKFLDATQTLHGVAASLGPLPSDTILTFHLIVRPLQSSTKGGKGSAGGDGSSSATSRCCPCVIQ